MKLRPCFSNWTILIAAIFFLSGCTANIESVPEGSEEETELIDEVDDKEELAEEDEIVHPVAVAGAFLTGIVKDEDGEPVPGTDIYPLGNPTNIQTSDEDGVYRIEITSEPKKQIQLIALKEANQDGKSLGVLTEPISITDLLGNKSELDPFEESTELPTSDDEAVNDSMAIDPSQDMKIEKVSENELSVNLALKPTGSLKGQAFLIPEEGDSSGIDIYIPGTGFIAKTDASGSYVITGIPEGSWKLQADFDGYYSAQNEDNQVVSNLTTAAKDLELFLSKGPQFSLKPENGKFDFEKSEISIDITYSPNTVLMRIAVNEAIDGISWESVEPKSTINLSREGRNIVLAQFADRNGLESDVKEYVFYYNDKDRDDAPDKVDCAPEDESKFQELSYSFVDSDGDGYFFEKQGLICTGDALPTGYKSELDSEETQDCDDGNKEKYIELAYKYVDLDQDTYFKLVDEAVFCGTDTLPDTHANTISENAINDCDDTDPTIARLFTGYEDNDGDYIGAGEEKSACLDVDAKWALSPWPHDCNDNDPNLRIRLDFYLDTDGDGYGAGLAQGICVKNATPPAGYEDNNKDAFPNDPARNVVENFWLKGGDPGDREPLAVIDPSGNKFVYGEADTDFVINLDGVNYAGPLPNSETDNDGSNRASYLIKFDSDDNIEFALHVRNFYLSLTGGSIHDGAQLDVHDMQADHEGNLYFAGTIMSYDGSPANVSFVEGSPHDPGTDYGWHRHYVFFKLNGNTGAVLWSKSNRIKAMPALNPPTVTSVGQEKEEQYLENMKVAIGGNATDGYIAVVGGTISGRVDIDDNGEHWNAEDIMGGTNWFVVAYDLNGNFIQTERGADYKTKTYKFGDVAVDSDKNIYAVIEDENIQIDGNDAYSIVLFKDPADGSPFVTINEDSAYGVVPHDLEINSNYIYYNYSFEDQHTNLRYAVNRRSISDFTNPKKIIFASGVNLVPKLHLTNMQVAPDQRMFLQFVGLGPLKYSIDDGVNYTDIPAPNTNSLNDQQFVFEFSDSSGFDIATSYEFGTSTVFAHNFAITPENKLFIGVRPKVLNPQIPAFNGAISLENSGQYTNMFWLEF